MEIRSVFHLWVIHFSNYKHASAGINTLISISDGLGPSIFCWKMEKARLLKEEVDRKVVYFHQSRQFDFAVVI